MTDERDDLEHELDQDVLLIDPVRVTARMTYVQADALFQLMALLTHDACHRLGLGLGETIHALEAFDRLRRNLVKRGVIEQGPH